MSATLASQVLQDPAEDALDEPLLALLAHLKAAGYHFVTPTRAVHARVRRRRPSGEDVLRDVFGWVRPVAKGLLPSGLERELLNAGILVPKGRDLIATVRVSTVDDLMFLHSVPNAGKDAVFLGPDSYRYARYLKQVLDGLPQAEHALDIGVGAGVGALTLLSRGFASHAVGADINPKALQLAAINARHAELPLSTVATSNPLQITGVFDLIVANPPFVGGRGGVTYSDGGEDQGTQLTLEWASTGVESLAPTGRFILYTGSPIAGGHDGVKEALTQIAQAADRPLTYEEIDPDIFGSLLRTDAYRDIERIAAVGAVIGPVSPAARNGFQASPPAPTARQD